ncbi:MAG TPA: alpha/beta fold hydrolase [Xanthobacteraceae bacterium]
MNKIDRSPRKPTLLQGAMLRVAALINPHGVDRRVVSEFLKPRRYLTPDTEILDLPPPQEGMRIATGDAWVAAWRWGNGPAVLFAHGWEDDHHVFDPMIAQLIAAGHSVIAFDLPAHGCSGGRRVALPSAAQAIADVAEALGPVRAVVGHSFGGAAATLAVSSRLKVERVVTVATPISMARLLDLVVKRLGLSRARRAGIERELVRRVGVSLAAVELEAVAPRLVTPALVVHSRDDRIVPFLAGVRLQRAWPGAKLFAVEGLGHRRILSDLAVMERLSNFLALPAMANETGLAASA